MMQSNLQANHAAAALKQLQTPPTPPPTHHNPTNIPTTIDITLSPDKPEIIIDILTDRYTTTPWKPHYDTRFQHLYPKADEAWLLVPRDHHGLVSVEFLQFQGEQILKSETRIQPKQSLCGKFIYIEAYRVNTYPKNQNIRRPNGVENQTFEPIPLHTLNKTELSLIHPDLNPPKYNLNQAVHLHCALYSGRVVILEIHYEPKETAFRNSDPNTPPWVYVTARPEVPTKHRPDIRALETELSFLQENTTPALDTSHTPQIEAQGHYTPIIQRFWSNVFMRIFKKNYCNTLLQNHMPAIQNKIEYRRPHIQNTFDYLLKSNDAAYDFFVSEFRWLTPEKQMASTGRTYQQWNEYEQELRNHEQELLKSLAPQGAFNRSLKAIN